MIFMDQSPVQFHPTEWRFSLKKTGSLLKAWRILDVLDSLDYQSPTNMLNIKHVALLSDPRCADQCGPDRFNCGPAGIGTVVGQTRIRRAPRIGRRSTESDADDV